MIKKCQPSRKLYTSIDQVVIELFDKFWIVFFASSGSGYFCSIIVSTGELRLALIRWKSSSVMNGMTGWASFKPVSRQTSRTSRGTKKSSRVTSDKRAFTDSFQMDEIKKIVQQHSIKNCKTCDFLLYGVIYNHWILKRN